MFSLNLKESRNGAFNSINNAVVLFWEGEHINLKHIILISTTLTIDDALTFGRLVNYLNRGPIMNLISHLRFTQKWLKRKRRTRRLLPTSPSLRHRPRKTPPLPHPQSPNQPNKHNIPPNNKSLNCPSPTPHSHCHNKFR